MAVDNVTSGCTNQYLKHCRAWVLTTLALFGVLALVQALNQPAVSAEAGPERLTSRSRPTPPAVKPLAVGDEIQTGSGQRRRVVLPEGAVLYLNQNTSIKLDQTRQVTVRSGQVLVETAARKKEDLPLIVKTPKREVSGRNAKFAVQIYEDGDFEGTGVVVTRGQVTVSGLDSPIQAGHYLPSNAKKSGPTDAVRMLDWARELIAAETPLVPGSKFTGGALVAVDPDGQETRLSLRKHHIDVYIEDGFARTTIDQTYFNHEARRLEGTFLFQVPPDASLSRLAMYVSDGKECNLMEGGMVERDYGRNVYEEIVYRQQDPALLERQEGGLFKMRVFPLEGRQEKRILLSYTQKLPVHFGQASYRFPASSGKESVRDWSFHARVKGGAGLAWASTSHELKAGQEGGDLFLDAQAQNSKPDRDVVVTLTDKDAAANEDVTRFSTTEHDGARYLLLRYRPFLSPGRAAAGNRKDWVILFESSGDRDPLLARTQVEVVRSLLAEAEPDDNFAVLTAGTRVRTFARELRPVTPENVQEAITFLENAHLVGALDLGRALTEAAPLLKAGQAPFLVHVGSGIAALGERRVDVLAKRIPDGTRYVGVGVGRRWARGFMKTAAERSGGSFTQINPDEPVGWRAFELAATLNAPRLLNAQVRDDAGRAVFLNITDSITQGEELCAIARLGPNDTTLPESVTITGTLDGKPFRRTVAVKDVAARADYLPRTWAKLEIDRLLAEDAQKNRKSIIELSKSMYVITPFTSLLVLENEEMYVQYKVDRGRKDHWAMYDCPRKIPVVYEPESGQLAEASGTDKNARKTAKQALDTVLVRVLSNLIPLSNEGSTMSKPLPTGGVAGINFTYDKHMIKADEAIKSWYGYDGRDLPLIKKLSYRPGEPEVLYEIHESPPAQVDRIIISGNELTRQNVILRQVPIYPGQVLTDPQKLNINHFSNWEIGLPREVPLGFSFGHNLSTSSQVIAFRGFTDTDGTRSDIHSDRMMRGVNDPMHELLNATEDLRSIEYEWERIWYTDQPSHLSPERVHGGINGAHERSRSPRDSLLYQRPSFTGNERLFSDLVAYASGMNTSQADVLAVLEAEAVPSPRSKPGQIDTAARQLLDKARPSGWQTLTFSAEANRPAFTIVFDGQGRYAWERQLYRGLREQVVCDGKTLLHLYPDLGIGARRSVSRFHRLDFARLVPWALPSAEDLARGADLRVVAERTVSIIPHGAESAKDKAGKPLPYARVQFVFAADGRLAERQVVEMPSAKVLYREVIGAAGEVKLLDAKGKELVVRKATLGAGQAPDLKLDTTKLVVLPLPYRTRAHVLQSLQIDKKGYGDLRFEDALTLFAADFAAQNGTEALKVFQQAFHGRAQRQLGFYVLLAACDQNLDAEHVDVLAEHLNEPLAQYLALYSSPVLRKHASQWAVGTGQWADGFLRHLAVTHALLQRWQNSKAIGKDAGQRQKERERALEYVRQNKGSAFGWALLGLLQDRANDKDMDKQEAAAMHRDLIEAWRLFKDVPGLAYAAHYEHARSLWKSDQHAEARKQFRALYEKTFAEDRLPAIDADFRLALLGEGREPGIWNDLLRKTADQLIAKKRQPAVLILARQCWQLGDEPMANQLLTATLEGVSEEKQRRALTLAGVGFLMGSGQLPRADLLLQKLLAEPKLAERASLWRLAAQLAEKREQTARALEFLERALEAEYRHLPEVINLKEVRRDYEKLLEHYQKLADAMIVLKVRPPADFVARVERTADRWRALDRESTAACQSTARILQTLGETDLVWDYLTTPVALQPGESAPWLNLAQALSRKGDMELADRAFHAAFEAEPTNAQVLWDRAQSLLHAGKRAEAGQVLRQLAEGQWQPRFHWIQTQARRQMENR